MSESANSTPRVPLSGEGKATGSAPESSCVPARSGARETEPWATYRPVLVALLHECEKAAQHFTEGTPTFHHWDVRVEALRLVLRDIPAPDPVPLAAEPRTGWQSIETAPKDGTLFAAGNYFHVFAAYYDIEYCVFRGVDHQPFSGKLPDMPTHWMPAPPQEPTP